MVARKAAKAKKKYKSKRPKPKGKVEDAPATPFRFVANPQTIVRIHFLGDAKPQEFSVADMALATLDTKTGEKKSYYQYQLKNKDGSGHDFWFLDPTPVDAPDSLGPTLWEAAKAEVIDGFKMLDEHSGDFSTQSITSYGMSACARTIVALGGHEHNMRMRLKLENKVHFLDRRPMVIRRDKKGYVFDAGLPNNG